MGSARSRAGVARRISPAGSHRPGDRLQEAIGEPVQVERCNRVQHPGSVKPRAAPGITARRSSQRIQSAACQVWPRSRVASAPRRSAGALATRQPRLVRPSGRPLWGRSRARTSSPAAASRGAAPPVPCRSRPPASVGGPVGPFRADGSERPGDVPPVSWSAGSTAGRSAPTPRPTGRGDPGREASW